MLTSTRTRRLEGQQAQSTSLLATDISGSTLTHRASEQSGTFAYTVFGYDSPDINLSLWLGFNAQLRVLPGIYLLGNGYRCLSTVLMRFTSPDSLSPFEAGGLNAYAYCAGDPVNNTDPSGHVMQTKGGVTIGQRNFPAKSNWIITPPHISSEERQAIMTTQRDRLLVSLSGLQNFSAYLKKLNAPGNLLHRAGLNARAEQITGQIKMVDDQRLAIEHSIAAKAAKPRKFDFPALKQLITDPENVAQDAAIRGQSLARIAKLQQANADVRGGNEYWRYSSEG